jgi:uncharacterized protein YndB with AHSA1/START domain
MPKPRHVHEIFIRTTPDRLWQALTDPQFTTRYYNGCAVTSTWERGTQYSYSSDQDSVIVGEIIEADPPRRLVMTFTLTDDEEAAAEPPSRVTWEIEPVSGDRTSPDDVICRLTLVHSDFGGLSKTWAKTASYWGPIVSGLKTLLETGRPLGQMVNEGAAAAPVDLDAVWHRDLGVDANQDVWALLGRDDRSPEEDEAMVRAAYASAYHWARAAGRSDANDARAEWMISHVHVVLGRAEPAQHHAARSMGVVERAGLADFDLAYAHEGLARAAACAGRCSDAAREQAAAAAVPIADDEDRKLFLADLQAGPWFGLEPSPA